MGTFLIVDSAIGLITAEHPPIGSVQLFGQVFWLGWLMIGRDGRSPGCRRCSSAG